MILQLGNARPKRRGQCFVAPGAILIGDITLGENSSVWFNAVVRADNDQISLGANTNVQDGAVLHCDTPQIHTEATLGLSLIHI